MKKILRLLLMIALIVLTLTACGKGNKDDNGGTPSDGAPQTPDAGTPTPETPTPETPGTDTPGAQPPGDTPSGGDAGNPADRIWAEDITSVIIDADSESGVTELRNHIAYYTGKFPDVTGTYAQDGPNEILLGDTGRALSDKAYKRLDRRFDLFALEYSDDSAYLIYAEGGELAIAYSDVFARAAAIDYIKNNIKDKTYSASGEVAALRFNTLEYVAEKREAGRELAYASIAEKLGEGAANAVRRIYSLYDEGIYVWFANLYDPSSGGFYYSGSARNTVGFLPDLESTAQGLNMLVTTGVTDDWANILTDEMKTKLLTFVYDMQSPDDYYYYHPQWGTSIGTSRRGRDAGWARDILEGLGQPPKYQKGVASASYLTERLGASSSYSSSKVVAVAAVADELRSEDAFREYLDNANIHENSYGIFNNLSARVTEIRNAGLWNFLLNYLVEHQYPNGLWEPTVSYQSVNGLMKISAFFNSTIPFPNPDKAIESALQVVNLSDSSQITQIVFVYNPWVAIKNIMPYCSAEQQESYQRLLTENAEQLLTAVYNKLALFKREDGGFSYMQDKTASTSQDVLVAVEDTKESDVNSTSIAISTVLKYVLRVFDVVAPSVYYEYDTRYFLELFHGMGEIIKDSAVADPEVVTFDDYNPTFGDEMGGVAHSPAEIIVNNVGDKDMLGNDYLWFTSSVVQNPAEGSKPGDLVLYAADFTYPDSDKKVAGAQSSTEIRISNYTAVGNCYIFESDIWFDGAGDTKNPALQLMYCTMGGNGQSAWLNFYPYEKNGVTYLRICDEWEGKDGEENTAVAGAIPSGEWFRLRIELYKETSSRTGKLDMRMKIYIDDVFVGESDSCRYINGEYQNFTVNAIRLAYYRHSSSAFYFNNMYAAKTQKNYVNENATLPGLNVPTSYDFEGEKITNGIFGYTYSTKTDSVGREVFYQTIVDATEMASGRYGAWFSLAQDPKNPDNQVLKIKSNDARSATAGSIAIAPSSDMGGSVHVIEYDYYLESNTVAKATLLNVSFVDALGLKIGGNPVASYTVDSTTSRDRGVFQVGTTSTTVSGVNTLDANYWYRIRIAWDQANGIIRYSYSIDGGKTWYSAASDSTRTSTSKVAWVEIVANTYNVVGVQYIDNFSYIISDTLPGVSEGKPDMGYVELVRPGGPAIYDFESGAVNSGDHINIDGNVFTVQPNASDYNESTDRINYSSITESGIYDGKYGVSMSIAPDVANNVNKVLRMQFTHSGSLKDTVITIAASTADRKNKVNVLEFDYYLDYQTRSGSTTPFKIRFNNEEDKAIGSSFNFIQQLGAPVAAGQNDAAKKAFSANGVGLYSKTWYKIRVIWDQNAGTRDFYYSLDGGATFIKLGETVNISDTTYAPSVSLVFTAYNWNGVQQLDNISYKILAEAPEMTIKELTPEEMGTVVPGGNTVYDFTTGAMNSDSHIKLEGHVYEKSPAASNTEYDPDKHHIFYDSISSAANYDGKYGTSLSIATDATSAANKVLKIHTTATSGAEFTTITVAASVMEEGGKVSVIEFDYRLLYQTNTGSSTPFKFQFNNYYGDSIGSSHNFITGNRVSVAEGAPVGEAFNYNGEALWSSTWYRIRIVWDRNEGSLYYYYSCDGGQTYIRAGEVVKKDAGRGEAESVTFMLQAYNWNGVQYIDNLSYKVLAEAPTYVEGVKPVLPEPEEPIDPEEPDGPTDPDEPEEPIEPDEPIDPDNPEGGETPGGDDETEDTKPGIAPGDIDSGAWD